MSANDVESEWRRRYEASIIARAEYQALAANPEANADSLDAARERMDRADALKAQVAAKLETAWWGIDRPEARSAIT